MFEYSPVPQAVQERQRASRFINYEKVLYTDPNPILKNYQPEPCFLTERFKKFDQEIKSFSVRNDDIWIISYPKTGTTFMSELITVLMSGLDFEKLEETPLMRRSPYLELSAIMETPYDFLEMAKKITTRRLMKTHLPVNLLPTELLQLSGPRMIYTIRNPKDAAVSFFHHLQNMNGYSGSFTDMLDGFLKGEVIYGSYFKHVEEYLRLSELKSNMLLVAYEDMVTDMPKVIRKVTTFLDIPLSHEDIEKVADYVHFDNMRERTCCKVELPGSGTFRFLRKGKMDSYKEEMPEEYINKFNAEMQKFDGVLKLYPGF